MNRLQVNFSNSVGRVKPMHATNNGPVLRRSDFEGGTMHPFNNNLEEFRSAGIPYARTHDTSFYHRYGLEHTVDVYYVFPDFDADPDDPESYDFACTDAYVWACEKAGVEVFYRLGHRIEHEVRRYGSNPPKDFEKWARVCEHIIRHYTEGWADGFRYKMTYWEIWNEPDLRWQNAAKDSPTWTGTKEEFFRFYNVVATHLKQCFPHLKIGGPALAHDLGWASDFLQNLSAPLDFFSWHCYSATVENMLERIKSVNDLLTKYGYGDVESILNEWNYVRGWHGDDIVYSHEHRGKIKGAAFTLAAMCACQYAAVDMLMYYDARPNEFWNGMFDDTVVGKVLKGYYPFPMFHSLYQLGTAVEVSPAEDGLYLCAAKNGEEAGVILCHYNNDDTAAPRTVLVELSGFGFDDGADVELFTLDGEKNLEREGKFVYYGDRFGFELTLPNFTCHLLKIRKKTV